jgi:hypothetical protein
LASLPERKETGELVDRAVLRHHRQSNPGLLPEEGCTTPSPLEVKALPVVAGQTPGKSVPELRLNNRDDVLCAELLRAMQTVGGLPSQCSNDIEWLVILAAPIGDDLTRRDTSLETAHIISHTLPDRVIVQMERV